MENYRTKKAIANVMIIFREYKKNKFRNQIIFVLIFQSYFWA